MTFVPTPPTPAPPSPPGQPRTRRFSRVQRLVMAGGLAVGLALGGAGISFAASSGGSSSSSTTTPPKARPKLGHGPRAFAPGLFGFAGLGQVVHGQATVHTRGGGYQKVAFQVGKVTAVSNMSITVNSTDNFSQSYVVTASTIVDAQRDGIGSVTTGDQVRVIATQSGATSITDMTKVQKSRAGLGFGAGAGRGHAPAASTPAAA